MTKNEELETSPESENRAEVSADIQSEEDFDIDDQAEDDSETSAEKPVEKSKLSWLVNDFHGVTHSVYEAVMVAAVRARQIGRSQKQEIDIWYKSHEPIDGQGEEEETEPGIDHFQHPKPTIRALDELSSEQIAYLYLDEDNN